MECHESNPGVAKNWLLVQLSAVLLTIEGALWTHGRAQAYWFVIAFTTLILCIVLSRPNVRDLGIGFNGILGASIAIPVALAFSFAALLAAYYWGTLRVLYGSSPVSWHAIFYAIWAFEQQFILNSFFYKRFEWLLGTGLSSMVLTAALFSLVHIPNPVLMPATFIGGLFFVAVFRRWRNIYPLAIAHAIMGLTLAITIPDNWIRHMRVGIGYFRFHLG
jgi:hypothetical protein